MTLHPYLPDHNTPHVSLSGDVVNLYGLMTAELIDV